MSVRLFIPKDTTAQALGAESTARAIAAHSTLHGLDIQIVRTGSRGLFSMEPLVEVETPTGRIAYGPVQATDVPSLFSANFLNGGDHPLRRGSPESIGYFARQDRLTFKRVGVIDPLSLPEYEAHGGWRALRAAVASQPSDMVEEIVRSGLRGRGGAAFPAGIKWRTVLQARAEQKYVVCNADEGDSGTFSDRMLMEGDPFQLIEGMILTGWAVGATEGYIYLRSEYPVAWETMTRALDLARAAGYLGREILGSGRPFELHLRKGAGAYICGEETAMLESLEGKRGMVRPKPPLPALKGLWGQPTVINNVMTLAAVPWILDHGASQYAAHGVGRSRGTLPFQLAGNIRHGGLVEKAFGVTLRELLYDFGGGSASGRPIRAVQIGGPLGAYLPESKFDTVLDYEAFAAAGAMVGHGGIVAFDDTVDMARMARYALEFCAIESCGKCTPCRIGSTRGVEVMDRILQGQRRPENLALLRDLCDTLSQASLCAMGGLTPAPVLSALQYFPEDFQRPPVPATGSRASRTLRRH